MWTATKYVYDSPCNVMMGPADVFELGRQSRWPSTLSTEGSKPGHHFLVALIMTTAMLSHSKPQFQPTLSLEGYGMHGSCTAHTACMALSEAWQSVLIPNWLQISCSTHGLQVLDQGCQTGIQCMMVLCCAEVGCKHTCAQRALQGVCEHAV